MQLPLPVQLPDDETFDSFEVGDNEVLLAHLQHLNDANSQSLVTYISGESGSGKSHLLHSFCHYAAAKEMPGILIDFKQKDLLQVEMMQGLEQSSFICLDDIHLLKGDELWQRAIFDLINRVKESGNGCFLVTANTGAKQLELELPDLQSRLTWGVSFHLSPLDDDLRVSALIKRANGRGLKMPEEVARYLLTHCQRDFPALMHTLDRLDHLSLQQKRRLTIPFVKQALSL